MNRQISEWENKSGNEICLLLYKWDSINVYQWLRNCRSQSENANIDFSFSTSYYRHDYRWFIHYTQLHEKSNRNFEWKDQANANYQRDTISKWNIECILEETE